MILFSVIKISNSSLCFKSEGALREHMSKPLLLDFLIELSALYCPSLVFGQGGS